MADVHRLGDVGRAEVDDDAARMRGPLEEEVFAAMRGQQGLANGCRSQVKIEKAGAGNLHALAPFGDVEFGQDVGSELPGVELAQFGERDQGIGLIIAEFGIGAGADQDRAGIRVRKDGGDGLLQALFEEKMHAGGGLGNGRAICPTRP